jgi:hypothetical protein
MGDPKIEEPKARLNDFEPSTDPQEGRFVDVCPQCKELPCDC